jgi:hypothetical protein
MDKSWVDVPEYMRPMTPDEFQQEKVNRFIDGFSDKLADGKRHARAFRHLQLGYRETEENHLLGPGVPEWHIVCELCGGSVLRIQSGGQPFNFDPVFLETATVRHLYMKHSDRLGMRDAREHGENQAVDRPGSGLLRNRYDRSVSGLRNQETNSGRGEQSTRGSRQDKGNASGGEKV